MKRLLLSLLLTSLFAAPLMFAAQPPSPDRSEAVLKKAAGYGDPGAQTDLGILYLQPDMRDTHGTEAKKWFLLAAASDYAPAEFNLAVMYLRGWGTEPDVAEAIRWFRKAGQHGMVSAKAYMGLLLLRSSNDREQRQGFAEIRDAAKHGDPVGMNSLGYCYDVGLGTKPDIAEAVNWYKHAVAKNDRGALHNLAKLYRIGYGVSPDIAQANLLDQKACEVGNLFACRDIAYAYMQGSGLTQDTDQAYRYGVIADADQQFLTAASAGLSDDRRNQLRSDAERWKMSHSSVQLLLP
jgi:TPR repeat protein